MGSEAFRPGTATALSNLFLAGTYVENYADVATIEGAVTLIQRFGSAANLNIHLHCLVLDGVYRRGTEGEPVFSCDITWVQVSLR